VLDLLDSSHIGSSKVSLHSEPVDLVALASEVAARYASELRLAGCPLELRAEARATGYWDRARLEQVIGNLLSNAIKYGSGGPIEIEVDADEERARCRVRDHGIGIAPEDQARIFERFERAVTREQYGGFGLGLWIVSKIVHAMDGRITVKSSPGRGACFTVELPRRLPLGAEVLESRARHL
jgi:signal transduction histidine kinase